MRLQLRLRLLSDATFGRGEGLAGLIDEEVEYDVATGLPFVRGRTLKGLLTEECANLLFALAGAAPAVHAEFVSCAAWLFGQPGRRPEDAARLHIGPALLPETLRRAVTADVRWGTLRPADVLDSLTAIRRQTAVAETTGAPEEGSLRSLRVLLRETPLQAALDFDADPNPDSLALLAACVASLRRAGLGRNRGRGRLTAELVADDATDHVVSGAHLQHFCERVAGGTS